MVVTIASGRKERWSRGGHVVVMVVMVVMYLLIAVL